MAFVPLQESFADHFIARRNQLDKCDMVSGFYNISEYQLLPDDFHIIFGDVDEQINNLFGKLKTILSFLYIVSASNISGEMIELKINGQKNVYSIEEIWNNSIAYEIYKWIYYDGNTIDKAAIARNILSLYCREKDIINIDNTIVAEIQLSFNLYLKEHVERYLSLKKDMASFVYDITEKFGEYTTELPNRFMKNLFTVAAFLFTVILTNAASENPLTDVFTADVITILACVLIGSVFYLCLTCIELNEKVNLASKALNCLKDNYSDILSAHDIKKIDSDFGKAKNYFKKWRKFWVFIWSLIIVVAAITLIVLKY